jgi:hypothetical protein
MLLTMNDLPIACSLTGAELQERRRTVLQNLKRLVVERREIKDGFAYSFQSDGQRLFEIASMIDLERQCCPFLRFHVTVEPGNGPIILELTGPDGTKEFLAEIFN